MKTKAAILYEINQPLRIEEVEIPELKEGQVLVKVLCSGICHSQINEIKGLRGEDKYLPHLLGHEGSGIVEKIGPGVSKVSEGDYVVLTWKKGQGKDAFSTQYNNNGETINSGAITTFSDYSVISENRLVKVDKQIPPDIAALLGCAAVTGSGIVKNELKGLKQTNTVGVFGIGGIGSSALFYLKYLGISKIIAIDINPSKLEFAKIIGATHTIDVSKENLMEKIKEITDGRLLDYAVESSGVIKVMEDAIGAINNQGTVVIAGNPKLGSRISLDPFDLIKGKKIYGTWGGGGNPDKDIPHYANIYLQGNYPINILISKKYSLDEINTAIEDLEKGIVVRPMIDFDNQ